MIKLVKINFIYLKSIESPKPKHHKFSLILNINNFRITKIDVYNQKFKYNK